MVGMKGYPVYEIALRTGKPSSDVLVSPVYQRMVFSFATPVMGPDGRFAGLVAVTLDPKKLSDLLARADPGSGTEVMLVDGKGQALAYSQSPPVQTLQDQSGCPPVARLLSSAGDSQGYMTYGGNAGSHLVGYSRVREVGWGVVVDSSAASILAGIRSERDTAFGLLLACVLAILIAGKITADRLAHPIAALADVADRFAAGDPTTALPESGVSQIARLASAVGQMRDRLAARTLEREQLLARLREANEKLVGTTLRSQQMATEAELQAARLDATISSIADGVMIAGPDSQTSFINASGMQILGFPPDFWSKPVSERTEAMRVEAPDGTKLSDREMPMQRALRGETTRGIVMKVRRHDGQTAWVSASSAPIRSGEGEINGAVATFTDVTELHELQERQQDLTRAVSHDLRTPLTAIQGQAQLLQRGMRGTEIDERLARSLDSIVANTKRMNSMIQDLVDSTKLESGQMQVERQPVELRSFLLELMERSGAGLDSERIRLEMADGVCVADADPNALSRIVTNLLSNALKYSSDGTEVTVSAEVTDGWVTMSVADQGTGIPPEDLPHVFERFYRSSTARRFDGLGLGLYITRMLVEAQGGTVRVESDMDRGSTFSFTLPAA